MAAKKAATTITSVELQPVVNGYLMLVHRDDYSVTKHVASDMYDVKYELNQIFGGEK